MLLNLTDITLYPSVEQKLRAAGVGACGSR